MTAKRKPRDDAKLQATIDRVFGVKGEPLNGRSPMEAYMERKSKVAKERAARVERIAKLMHAAIKRFTKGYQSLYPVTNMEPWDGLPDHLKGRYRYVARAVIAELEK